MLIGHEARLGDDDFVRSFSNGLGALGRHDWCGVACFLAQIKPMDFGSGQGANHSDTRSDIGSYSADLQRRPGAEDAVLEAR